MCTDGLPRLLAEQEVIYRACWEAKTQPPDPPCGEVALLSDKHLSPQKSHVHFCRPSTHLHKRVCPWVTSSLHGQDREETLCLLNHCFCFLSTLALATRSVKGHST